MKISNSKIKNEIKENKTKIKKNLNANKNFGIYIHIPFCDSKCSYCNFVSGIYNETIKKLYFDALKNEIVSDYFLCKQNQISSIYFGGGTPSSVNPKYIVDTLKNIRKTYLIKENAEISIECNPCSVDLKKLKNFKNAGFNRISFGAQSFDDEVLELLGRRHQVSDIFNAVQMALNAGFENIGIDLIIGLKKINISNFEQNILKLKNYGLKHISVYMLIIEKNTKLYSQVQNGSIKPLSDDESVSEYNKIFKILKNLRFNRYEISNFALNGYECKHNQNYWECGEYLSFGISAHSYIQGKRIENTSNISKYIEFFDNNKKEKPEKFLSKSKFNIEENKQKSIYNIEILTQRQKIEEYIMLSLRTKKGINLFELECLGFNIFVEKANEINMLLSKNIIRKTPTNLFVNEKHFGVLNQIILKLLP